MFDTHCDPFFFTSRRSKVFENGSVSNVLITNGQMLWSKYVAYQPDVFSVASNMPGDQTLGRDSFTFKVFDSHWNYSVPATINVTVMTGVSALVDDGFLWQCYEDMDNEVLLYGTAIDDSEGFLWFTITGVPHVGSLFDAATNRSVEVGSTLSTPAAYPYEHGTSVIYRPPRDFFTEPTTHWNGSQLSALDDVGSVSFYTFLELGTAAISSPESSQKLKVTNTNDNSTLNCTDQILSVRAMGAAMDDDETRPDQVFIYNISVTEKDKGVDPIRVDLDVDKGYVSLNETQVARLEFSAVCSATQDWTCDGNAFFEQNMVFIGAPEDVQNAFYGMRYFSYDSFTMDYIDITLYDGSQGDCLREFSTKSLRPTCAPSSCRMQINVTSAWMGWNWSEEDDIPTFFYTTIYQAIILLMFVAGFTGITLTLACNVLCSCCCSVCRICRKRKTRPGRRKEGHTVTDQEGAASKALKNTRPTPANIPLGRNKRNQVFAEHHNPGEGVNEPKQKVVGVCPLPWLGSLRHYKVRNARSNAGVSASNAGVSQDNAKRNPITAMKSAPAKQPQPSWGYED